VRLFSVQIVPLKKIKLNCYFALINYAKAALIIEKQDGLYTYVEACRSQKQEDLITCMGNTLQFYGGVPKADRV
jgi:transposase